MKKYIFLFILLFLSFLFLLKYFLQKKEEYQGDENIYISPSLKKKARAITLKVRREIEQLKPEYSTEDLYWLKNITFGIKTYNRPECLLRLLKSILKFYPPAKIIVVDDSYIPIFSEHITNIGNITFFTLPFNKGTSYGRNIALFNTNTRYFQLLDDDMIVTEETNLKKFYDFLENHPDYIAIGGSVTNDKDYPGIYSYDSKTNIVKVDRKYIEKLSDTITRSQRCLYFCMFRTDLLKQEPWDPNIKTEEHTEHFYRISKLGYPVAEDSSVYIEDVKDCENDIFAYRVNRDKFYNTYIIQKHGLNGFDYETLKPVQKKFAETLKNFKNQVNFPFHLFFTSALEAHVNRKLPDKDEYIFLAIFKNNKPLVLPSENYSQDEYKIISQSSYTESKIMIFFLYLDEYSLYYILNDQKYRLPFYEPETIFVAGDQYYILPENILSEMFGGNWFLPQNISYQNYNNSGLGFKNRIIQSSNNFVNDYFGDEIFYINIDSRVDKKNLTEKELKKLGIRANRFSAVTPLDPRVNNLLLLNKLKKGEIGCFLSHTDIWKDIIRRKVPWTLIFEDDIYFPPGVTQKTFGDSMKEAFVGNRNPVIIYFGHCLTDNIKELKRIYPDTDITLYKGNPDCTHAYCISYEGAKFLLSEMNESDLSLPIDEMMRNIMKGETYLILPYKDGDIILPHTGKKETYFGEGIVLQHNKIGSDIRSI